MIAQTSFTIDAETEALPTGFLQVRDFYILSGQYKSPFDLYNTIIKWTATVGTSTTGLPTHLQF